MDGLTLLALVGIVDPPRPAAKAAIATAHDAGIQVRMITGDHAITASAIARELGIPGRAISGAQFAEMTEDQADAEIDEIGVIARVTPEQKVRLVDILKRKGHVVGMTGDGVNDAPALKRADIGIAMGITGTEVSKEAAAMILTDDNFATIVKAVELGRGLYDNLVKYIRFQMGALAGTDPDLPRREHPQHRQRDPVPAAADAVGQLHHAGLPGGRPRLRQAQRGAHGAPPAQARAADPDPRGHLWFVVAGLVMAVATLAVIAGAEHDHGDDAGAHDGADDVRDRQPGLLLHRPRRAALGVQPRHVQRPHVRARLAASAAAIIFATELGFFQRILDTVELTGNQWLICIGGGTDRRRRLGDPQVPAAPPRAAAGMSEAARQRRSSQAGEQPRLAILLAMAMFVLVVDTSLMNVSISAVVDDLDTTVSGVQSAIALEALVSAAFILIGGKVGDLIGRKRAYVLGLLGYAIGALSMVFAQSLTAIIVFWAIVGGIGAPSGCWCSSRWSRAPTRAGGSSSRC